MAAKTRKPKTTAAPLLPIYQTDEFIERAKYDGRLARRLVESLTVSPEAGAYFKGVQRRSDYLRAAIWYGLDVRNLGAEDAFNAAWDRGWDEAANWRNETD